MKDQTDVEVPPLQNRTGENKLYTRPQEIEDLLAGLVRLPEEEVLARAAVRRRSAPGWLPGECLVHMMRRAARRGDRRLYEKWCRLLLERIKAQLLKGKPEERAKPSEIAVADYGVNRFARLLGPDLTGYNTTLDIYEARFDLGIANLRRDGIGPKRSNDKKPVEVEIGDNPMIQAEVEAAKADLDLFGFVRKGEEDFRSRVWEAIDALPPEQNRILTMEREGIAVGEMAKIMSVTPRTILNWKNAAFETVRKTVLGDEQ